MAYIYEAILYVDVYALAYMFIPELVDMYNEGRVSLEYLSNTDLWYSTLQEVDTAILLDWSCVKAEYIEVSDKLVYVFYSFPEPKISPDARYSIAVIRSEGESRKAEYYTLEYTTMLNSNGDKPDNPYRWTLGGQDRECHYNYWLFEKYPTKENLINAVLNFHQPHLKK